MYFQEKFSMRTPDDWIITWSQQEEFESLRNSNRAVAFFFFWLKGEYLFKKNMSFSWKTFQH